MRTGIFDLFKVGIGPSSSHTVGPMRAGFKFASRLEAEGQAPAVRRLQCELFGSLALTGKGHGTDTAVLLGLSGQQPDLVEPEAIEGMLRAIRGSRSLPLCGKYPVPFAEETDLLYRGDTVLAGHPNGMRFSAYFAHGKLMADDVYYSIGGGFITREGDRQETAGAASFDVPHTFSNAAELMQLAGRTHLPIWKIMLENESVLSSEQHVRERLWHVWQAMESSIDRGLRTEGILPGGLHVQRRAPRLWKKIGQFQQASPYLAMDQVNAFAMAVNEENAAGGRIVTAPTNGAAGLIPAVGRFYRRFEPEATDEGLLRYLLTAGAIGILYKENASISGAEVGCQGEVGVACSMAAGGLVGALGGTAEEVEHAAEIGMEHHLGMTCDPIGGLVQIPCIERNAFGAVKAINACRMAMQESGEHKVSLDQVIRTMYETGLDMQSRYKETALAGLAVNVKDC